MDFFYTARTNIFDMVPFEVLLFLTNVTPKCTEQNVSQFYRNINLSYQVICL